MKTRGAQDILGVPRTRSEFGRRSLWIGGLLVFAVAQVLNAIAAPSSGRQSAAPQNPPGSTIVEAKCVIGLEDIKPGAKGTLASLPTELEFTAGKKKADIAISSIQDVFTGQDTKQDVGGMSGTMVKAAIPYGGGRVVSLFTHNVDVLTVEYLDSGGGFHGTIFVLPASKAEAFRNQLIAQGAKVSKHVDPLGPKEQKP
jgi:hypothetical protein